MADEADRAQRIEEQQRSLGVQAALRPDPARPFVIEGLPCCCECGTVIPRARLEARPDAARCIECQALHDRQQRMYARR